ncbi:elongation factor P [Patescibacteria group bacterium]|nr:elongation factor P [Patescibacteria group bacterium]MBU4368770.1 elongation factor P [Patescibacteria group bacterium]MBU4579879.1 elongation factor P [Patescibacteria group bacterium]
MLSIRDLEKGMYIVIDGAPYEVVDRFFRAKQQRESTAVAKLKNLLTGAAIEKTFQAAATIEEAHLDEVRAQFLYKDGGDFNFMNEKTYDQFSLSKEQLKEKAHYLLEEMRVKIKSFQGTPLTIELPPEVNLKVVDAPPGVRGDRETAGTKTVTLETGLQIDVPLHIKEGDVLRIKTKTGKYDGKVER